MPGERGEIVGRIRDSLQELAQEGIAYVGRGSAPPRARTLRQEPQRTPEPRSPQRGTFRPRVAALAEPLELSSVAAKRAGRAGMPGLPMGGGIVSLAIGWKRLSLSGWWVRRHDA